MMFLLGIIYLSFISLGLPDALLGSAWPNIYLEFEVPVSYAGIISMIIAVGTVISSLLSDCLTKKYGTGKVTAISVGTTALALFGFSISHNFISLCLWAIPYGLGAGSVDASLNNYVALHFSSKHMSWLHCMWGIGATLGPYIMGLVLTNNKPWNDGYLIISILQVILTIILIASLKKWKKQDNIAASTKALSLKEILNIPGAKEIMICFFCYSAIEQTSMLWASSYLNLAEGIDAKTAATFASLFCIGITIGRGINGFIAMKLKDEQMIHMGIVIISIGIISMFLSYSLLGFILIGLGCAPIYPCIIHSTPNHFGANNSQAIIGVQMASAYIGTCLMPPLFGSIARHLSIKLLPIYLLLFLLLMTIMNELLNKKAKGR